MNELSGIFAGVLLSGATSLSLGTILFRRLGIELERIEHVALAFVVGSACFSQIIFFLCSTGLARKNVFFAIGLLAGIGVLDPTRKAATRPVFDRSPVRWTRLL